MKFSSILSQIQKYLGVVIVGVQAAAAVPNASNADKKTTVLATICGVTDAVATATGNPEIEAVGAMVDVVATIINTLTTKTAAAAVPPVASVPAVRPV